MSGSAARMELSEPVVRTDGGLVRGRLEGGVGVFRGIPYARPPVGALRFAAPAPAEPWDGVREAAAFGPPPPQSDSLPLMLPAAPPGTDPDDWLTVNVWTPSPGASEGLPVLVWIYGGAYRIGSSSQPSYDGATLARAGLVVVTFNHRIGVEGYAHLPGVPANRALLDDVAALTWVRDNIGAFGGDPARVTVAGESAGAGAIACLLAMPAATGLFRRAIANSVPGPLFSPELAASITAAIAAQAGVAPTAAAFAEVPPDAIIAAADAVPLTAHTEWGPVTLVGVPFSPVVDGEVLPASPWQALATGASHKVDLLTGHNKDEYRLFLEFAGIRGRVTEEMADQALHLLAPTRTGIPGGGEKAYRGAFPGASPEQIYELVFSDWLFRMPSLHLAQAHAAGGGRTFLYELTYQPGPLGACHGLDVPLFFGNRAELGLIVLGQEWPAEAVALSELIRGEWAAFAASGDPGWPPYAPGRRTTRIYDTVSDVDSYPEEGSLHIWDQHRFTALDLDIL
jgi:para-nitrobenzyl esterase